MVKKSPAPTEIGLVLGIETATARGGVALVSPAGEIVGETTLASRESHAELLLPALGQLLAALGSSPQRLTAVAVSRGPGSFTGLRTGIATAKGLAFSLGLPLYGIPTIETLAANASPGAATVCALLNVRRGEHFQGLFRYGTAGLERLDEDRVVQTAALAAGIPAGALVLGEVPQPLIDGAGGPEPRWRIAPEHLNHPRAAVVALSGLRGLRAGRPSELHDLLPAYVRGPDAAACAPAR